MTGPEPPEDPKYPQLFENGLDEETGARNFLLWIQECYLEVVNYHDPNAGPDQIDGMIATEYEDTEDQVRFAELGPKAGVVAGRYLAESAGTFGKWKVIVRRNNKGKMKTPWAYEFEEIAGDLKGLYRYDKKYRVIDTLRKDAPL